MKLLIALAVVLMCPLTGRLINGAIAQEISTTKAQEQLAAMNFEIDQLVREGRIQEATPLAESAVKYAVDTFGEINENTIETTYSLGLIYNAADRWNEAESAFEFGLANSLSLYGPDSSRNLRHYEGLSFVYTATGNWRELERVSHSALLIASQDLSLDSEVLLLWVQRYTSALSLQGRLLEAQALLERAIEVATNEIDPHPELAAHFFLDLASIYATQERKDEAEYLFESAIDVHSALNGEQSIEALRAMQALAAFNISIGKFDVGIAMYRTVINSKAEILGQNSGEVLDAMHSLVLSLMVAGAYGEANEIIDPQLQQAREGRAASDSSLAEIEGTYAFLLLRAGQISRAESVASRVLNRAQNSESSQLASVYSAMTLAEIRLSQSAFDEAERIYAESMEDLINSDLAGALDATGFTNTIAFARAKILEGRGKFAEAESIYRSLESPSFRHGAVGASTQLALLLISQGKFSEADEVISAQKRKLVDYYGLDHPAVLEVQNARALFLIALGAHEEAKTVLLDTIDKQRQVFGNDSLSTLSSMLNLSNVYLSLGDLAKAREILETILKVGEESLGAKSRLILTTRHNLAALHFQQANYEAGESAMMNVIATRKSFLGLIHPDTRDSMNYLAFEYLQNGQEDKAAALLEDLMFTHEQATKSSGQSDYRTLAHYAYLLSYEPDLMDAAIFQLKIALSKLETTIDQAATVDSSYAQSFLEQHTSVYRTLQEWLIQEGRFLEAEEVGRLLKVQEFRDYVSYRGPSLSESSGSTRDTQSEDESSANVASISLTAREIEWSILLDRMDDRPNEIGVQLAAFRRRQSLGEELTEQELENLRTLESQNEFYYSQYKSRINDWLESVKATQNNTVRAEANEIEIRYHDDLQFELQQIGEDVAVLQIVALEDSLHSFLITPFAFKHTKVEIGRTELNRLIFEARAQMQPTKYGTLGPPNLDVLRELHDVLIAPVSAELKDAGVETIMLNLQGAIRYVPFSALHDGEKYQIERYRFVTFTPAARTRFERPRDVTFGVGFGAASAPGNHVPLPGVREELNRLWGNNGSEGILDGDVYLDGAFTRGALEAALVSPPPVVHIASHFYMRPGADAQSVLLLGDGSLLSMAEINSSPKLSFRGVQILSLSACSTGLSSKGDAEIDFGTGVEVEGFGILAQRKGAEAVIATLWNVADDSTSKLMARFYRGIVDGDLDKSEALRRAQLSVLNDPNTSHPYFWAPFVLMGNWK